MVKVLIADDEKDIVDIMKEEFEYFNPTADIITISTGEETLDLLLTGTIDIAFLDNDFGQNDTDIQSLKGKQVCKRIKDLGIQTIIVGIGTSLYSEEWICYGADFANVNKKGYMKLKNEIDYTLETYGLGEAS